MMNRFMGVVVGMGLALALGMPSQSAAVQIPATEVQRAAVTALRPAPAARALHPMAAMAPVIQEDPANELYRAARAALREREYREAAQRFARIRSEYAQSGYVADSYYYEAFARQRIGGEEQLREAQALLKEQSARYREARTMEDSEALRARIEAQLARGGDAESWGNTQDRAAQQCGEQDGVRMAALSALINMNPERARPILMEVLQDRDDCSSELRSQAIFLLSQDMTPEVVEILVDLAVGNPDPDSEVRSQAVFWLGQSDSPEAQSALQAVLTESDDPELQQAALFAMSQSGGEEAMAALIDAVRRTDLDREVRAQAIFSISQHPGPESNAVLREIYPTLDPELQGQVLFALGQSSDPENRDFLRARALDESADSEVRKNAIFWLAQSQWGLSVAELTSIYESTRDDEVKEHLLFVASQSREEGTVDFLIRIASDESVPELQEQAVFWLGQSDDPRAADFLLELIRR